MSFFPILTLLDVVALALLVICWLGIGLLIEHPGGRRPSVTILMAEYRREWMRELLTRDVRIFDSQILASLRQGTSFFASTCLLAVGGVLALIGNTDPLEDVAEGLTHTDSPVLLWQIKLMLVALFLTHAFLKFVWANRIFGYCSVMMAAVPLDPKNPKAATRASMAGELNIRAAWNFNRGLRSMYFALGSLAWLLGAVPLMVATGAVVWLLWSREFASSARKIVLTDEP
ncbi:hypothetical protein LOM8899_00317 [Flavimaricola marinus]|uniref:DUF599 domain-containing protein n=2 Tax=Flavimaricola marinus TaxID=1819565 RepID=A0A238L9V5_9RHOB|nr:hypothetical protein LOM8899_00317 [Flavimaricola marinus]